MDKKNIISGKVYRGYPINNGVNKNFDCHKITLDQAIDQIEYMAMNHSKVLNTRIDVHSPVDNDEPITRSNMTRIIENSKRLIERQYSQGKNKPDWHCVWVAERTKKGMNEHYHLNVNVNGNAIQNGRSVFEAVNTSVKRALGTERDGYVNFSASNGKTGIMINRNSSEFEKQMADAVYAASYIAKTSSKKHRHKGARISSASRLPKGWKESQKYQDAFDTSERKESNGITNNAQIYEPECSPHDTDDNYSIACPPDHFIELCDDNYE